MQEGANFFLFIWDQFNSLDLNGVNGTVRLVLSLALGAVIGAERKHKGQIAGVRTFALISLGACLAMLLSIYVPQVYLGLKNGDPGRIAAQVITGIGFLGGGAMIQSKGSVRGLTTAAGIWMTAITGMAIGVGMYSAAIGATVLCMLVLIGFESYEKRHRYGAESRVINVSVKGIVSDITPYRRAFEQNDIHLSTYYVECDYEEQTSVLSFVIQSQVHSDYLPVFRELEQVAITRSITLSSQVDI